MPRTAQTRRTKQSIEAQFALAERVLRGIDRTIEEQIERKRDLEVARAVAMLKSGKATLHDSKEIIEEARRRIG